MSSLTEIARQLAASTENIQLVYAFNATGKTRLSVEYKNITKNPENGQHTGVYYNAFSEDLFVWHNDEENDNFGMKLQVVHSSLNRFHSLLTPELVYEKLALYDSKYVFRFNMHDNPERGIESITFYLKEDNSQIKISRGEERIFVWCFFLTLFDVDGWANQQDAHFFIDDPVSSLDDHNIFVTADSIFNLIEANYLRKRIVITTHHIGLFSILFDRLKKGEKSSRYRNLVRPFILSNKNNELLLKHHDKAVFLFHLHLMQTLSAAIQEQLYLYHFVLLRQVLENISSFLGSGRISHCLSQIGVTDIEIAGNQINSLSHQDTYRFQFNEMSPQQETFFKDIFQKLQVKYNFIY